MVELVNGKYLYIHQKVTNDTKLFQKKINGLILRKQWKEIIKAHDQQNRIF